MKHTISTPSRGKGPYGQKTSPYDQTLEPVQTQKHPKLAHATVYNEDVHKASDFPPSASVLRKAEQAVHGPRQEAYGPPEVNHGRTAALWQAYLDGRSPGPLTAEDVCWMSLLVKMSRQMHEHSEDNLVDAAGYVENISLIRDSE